MESHFQAHAGKLNSFCYRLIGDREAARDITQDVFLEAHQGGKIDAAWLYVCARSRCVDHLRRRGVWQRIVAELGQRVSTSERFEQGLADRDLCWSVLRRLPEKARSLLLLRAYAGMDYEQLAQVFSTTPESIAVMLHRARKKSAQLLEGTP